MCFACVDAFEFADFFDGVLLAYVAPDGVNGVGGVDDDAAVAQNFGHVCNDFRVGVFVVESDHVDSVRYFFVICSGYCR